MDQQLFDSISEAIRNHTTSIKSNTDASVSLMKAIEVIREDIRVINQRLDRLTDGRPSIAMLFDKLATGQ